MLRKTHAWIVAAALGLLGACADDAADEGVHAQSEASALAQQSGSVPCAITQILEKRCHTCHGPEPLSAPFSLVTLADLTGPSFFDEKVPMDEVIKVRINSTNRREKMPPPAITSLTPEELTAFNTWLDEGAQAGPACGEAAPVDTGVDAGSPAPGEPADAGVATPDAGAAAADVGGLDAATPAAPGA